MKDLERIIAEAIDCGLMVHRDLGPGLLESVYEAFLAAELEARGLTVERQKSVAVTRRGITIAEGFRIDLLISDCLNLVTVILDGIVSRRVTVRDGDTGTIDGATRVGFRHVYDGKLTDLAALQLTIEGAS